MRFTLIDCMLPVVVIGFTAAIAVPPLSPPLVAGLVLVAVILGYYLALAPFVYRKFGLWPMLLPRCACCGQWGRGG